MWVLEISHSRAVGSVPSPCPALTSPTAGTSGQVPLFLPQFSICLPPSCLALQPSIDVAGFRFPGAEPGETELLWNNKDRIRGNYALNCLFSGEMWN